MSEIRIVTGLAVVFSLGTILTCLIAVPAIYYEAQDIWNEIDTDMREFRVLTDDAWLQMQVNWKNREHRRAARHAYETAVEPEQPNTPAPTRGVFNKDETDAPLKQKKCQCNLINKCPPGPPGSRGPPGRPGMEGEPGLDGPNGRDAADVQSLNQQMNVCFYCPPGKQGIQGPMGPPGIVGMRGARGQDGMNGRNGRPGSPGPKGDVGPEGEPGTPGPLGDPGLNGSAGRGQPGLKGIPGEAGDMGEQGYGGKNGADGEIGRRGVTGIRGRPGRDGQTGPQGPMGVTGPPGRDAHYCPCPSRKERLGASQNKDQGYSVPAPPAEIIERAKPAASNRDEAEVVREGLEKIPREGLEEIDEPSTSNPAPTTATPAPPTPLPNSYRSLILPAAPAPPAPPAPVAPPEHPAVLVPIEVRTPSPVVRRVNSDFRGGNRGSRVRPAWNLDPRLTGRHFSRNRSLSYGRKL